MPTPQNPVDQDEDRNVLPEPEDDLASGREEDYESEAMSPYETTNLMGPGAGPALTENTEQDEKGHHPQDVRRPDQEIREDIEAYLRQRPDIEADKIQVEVQGGVVTLKGEASSQQSKRVAESVVEGVAGVQKVNNLIHDRTGKS